MGLETLALIGIAAGTGAKISGALQQGEDAQKIAEARAQIDLDNAEAARKASVEEARIQKDKGRRLRATQKGLAAAANIRINVGAPLVIEAETKDIIAQNTGFILERGRTQADAFRSSAALEIATGKQLKKKSKFAALSAGLSGLTSIAFLGLGGGSGKTNLGSLVGRGGSSVSLTTPGLFAGTNAAPGFGIPTAGGNIFA